MVGGRDRIFFALSDQTRCTILQLLSTGEPMSLSQIARHFSHSVPGTLKHLAVLLEAGLVQTVTLAGSKLYTFQPESLSGVQRWLNALVQKQTFALREPISLSEYLQELGSGAAE